MANSETKETPENKNKLTKKKDFIELEFIGKNLTNNGIFDSNILEEAKKLNPEIKETKPLVICIGEGFVVKGLDEFLEGKETGKKYTLKLTPEKAFGKRDSKLIKLMPMRIFAEQKVYPQPGMTFALDNALVKIISVSGGRVLVDFNNPLASKEIEYEFTIKKIVSDDKEKINALQNFLFGQIFDFDIEEVGNEKEGKKKIVFKELRLAPILNAFKDKFKEILGMDIEILEKKKEEVKKQSEEIEASKNASLGKEEKKKQDKEKVGEEKEQAKDKKQAGENTEKTKKE
jgi:FKBP-type peptidyl-prolyl cis-trans isomerase SlyD